MVREGPAEPPPPPKEEPKAPTYSAQDARGGEIVLRSRQRRMIFIAGLVGVVVLVILLRLVAG
ncbi:MAG: hypothetical protein AB7K64_05660 [Variibacter sp.]